MSDNEDIDESIARESAAQKEARTERTERRERREKQRVGGSSQDGGVDGGERPPSRPSASGEGAQLQPLPDADESVAAPGRNGATDRPTPQTSREDAGRRSEGGSVSENAGPVFPPELMQLLMQSPQHLQMLLQERINLATLIGTPLGQAGSMQVAPQHVATAPQIMPMPISVPNTDMRIAVAADMSSPLAAHNNTQAQRAENGRATASELTPLSAPRRAERSEAESRALRHGTKDIREFSGKKHEKVDTYIRDMQDLIEEFDLQGVELRRAFLKTTTDEARICIESMNEEAKFNPEKIFEKLRLRFRESVSLQSFNIEEQNLKQKPFEQVREYYAVAENLRLRKEKFMRETRGEAEADHTRSLRNSEITSSFMAGLRPELLQPIAGEEFEDLETLYVRLLKIEKGLEMVERAAELRRSEVNMVKSESVMQVANAAATFPRAGSAQQSGRRQETPFPKGTCFKCGSPEHYANACPLRREGKRCYVCGDPNHFGAVCVNKICQLCKQPGHWQHQCIVHRADTNQTQTESKNL
jgi:Zinc knuckle